MADDLALAAAWHRQAAALLAEAQRAGMAEPQWPAIRDRLLAQKARFAELATSGRAPQARLAPAAADVAAVSPGLGDLSIPAVRRAIDKAIMALDTADQLLATGTPRSGEQAGSGQARLIEGGWPGPRNAVVYGGYALVVLAVQVILFLTLDEQSALPSAAPLCLLILPAMAWAAGWLTIGALFRPPAGADPTRTRIDRSPRLGAAICLTPGLLLCAGLLALSAIR